MASAVSGIQGTGKDEIWVSDRETPPKSETHAVICGHLYDVRNKVLLAR